MTELFRKILVPVDFSAGSRQALQLALALARSSGARVDALYVWEPPRVVPLDVQVFNPGQTAPLLEHARRAAEERMREFLDDLGLPATERPSSEIAVGDPTDEIVERAAESGYDLLVLGAHGRSGIARLLLGSVAEKVIRRSPCPVLVVRGSSEGVDR